MPRLNAREAPVLRACLDLLRLRGVFAWRNNSGALRDASGRLVRFGLTGSPDVIGVLEGGRLIAVECKRPDGGKLSDAQREFLEATRHRGAVAVVIADVAVLERVLTRLSRAPHARFTLEGEEIA